jgi:drug/metabolite transporter (DMT)-like permease
MAPHRTEVAVNRVFVTTLLILGAGWGLTQPLGKMATATGHPPMGLIFWQLVICTAVLGTICLWRGRWPQVTLATARFAVIVAVLGTLIPNYTFYTAVAHLPAGIMSIIIAAVPMLAFPLALAVGIDRFSLSRLAGLGLGLIGVLLIALPTSSLPDRAATPFLTVALIGPLFYAMEATYVARWGTARMDAVGAMFAASAVGAAIALPMTFVLGQWINPLDAGIGHPELALIAASAIHAVIYAAYVWLAATAGAVFAAQSSYLVTATGLIWAMALLGERFAPTVWLALAVMLSGVALVQPRKAA